MQVADSDQRLLIKRAMGRRRTDRAHISPSRLTFFCSLYAWDLTTGPKMIPPPRHCSMRELLRLTFVLILCAESGHLKRCLKALRTGVAFADLSTPNAARSSPATSLLRVGLPAPAPDLTARFCFVSALQPAIPVRERGDLEDSHHPMIL